MRPILDDILQGRCTSSILIETYLFKPFSDAVLDSVHETLYGNLKCYLFDSS